jgi:hypothetical protein
MRVHFSGYAPAVPAAAAGTACRPDGEWGRGLVASSDPDAVTCRACLAKINV